MIFNKKDDNIKMITPDNLGWYEVKLLPQELEYVWKCVNDHKESDRFNGSLAGNIDSSYLLKDRSDWFFNNTLAPLCKKYRTECSELVDNKFIPLNQPHPLHMKSWWVNYQKQGEFNPFHKHYGLYSFVIWLKIPFEWRDQNRIRAASGSGDPQVSSFEICYTNLLGEMCLYDYKIGSEAEGIMLFFPASLYHQVYPFYNCDEERISVSGNIAYNTAVRL